MLAYGCVRWVVGIYCHMAHIYYQVDPYACRPAYLVLSGYFAADWPLVLYIPPRAVYRVRGQLPGVIRFHPAYFELTHRMPRNLCRSLLRDRTTETY